MEEGKTAVIKVDETAAEIDPKYRKSLSVVALAGKKVDFEKYASNEPYREAVNDVCVHLARKTRQEEKDAAIEQENKKRTLRIVSQRTMTDFANLRSES